MQRYTVHLYLETARQVSGGISTLHQEHTQLYLQYLVLVKPLLLPAAIVEELELQFHLFHDSRQVAVTVWQLPDTVDTVVCAPDDGCRYHTKHVERFPDINKLCNVASCWIYTGNILTMHGPLNVKHQKCLYHCNCSRSNNVSIYHYRF